MTSRKSPAPNIPRPTVSSKRLSEAELSGLIDEGIEKSLHVALAVLNDPNIAGYVKLAAAKLFYQPMMRRLAMEEPDTAITPQEKFLHLMAEVRKVPAREVVVTDKAIEDVPVDMPEFDMDADADTA